MLIPNGERDLEIKIRIIRELARETPVNYIIARRTHIAFPRRVA